MIKKPTDELMDALNQCSSVKEYINNEQDYLIDSAVCDYLNQLLEEKSLKKSTVIKNSELNLWISDFFWKTYPFPRQADFHFLWNEPFSRRNTGTFKICRICSFISKTEA